MLIGHKKQWSFLKKRWLDKSLSHAYLFTGLDSLGKKHLALEFVKLINCSGKEKIPCNKCYNCRMILKSAFPDFLIIEPQISSESQESIQIKQIRRIQEFISYRPYMGSFKVVIINNADKMNRNSQNCLLKTLEEPKGNTIIILISSYPEMLLPTISSRCELMKFFYVKKEEIKNYLLENNIDGEKADSIISFSPGRPGKILRHILNCQEREEEIKILKDSLNAMEDDFASRVKLINNLVTQKKIFIFLEVMQKFLRHTLLEKLEVIDKRKSIFSNKFEDYSITKIKEIIRKTEKINNLLSSTNINPKLALENLLLEI